ncbi:ABC transporter ATP-binding protein, partial [Verminephrobacter sp. Larva24]
MPGGSLPQAAAGFADANEQILRVEGLTVSFDGFKAVDGLSLSVERNELRVIIGPNGA